MNSEKLLELQREMPDGVQLIAVSKFKPASDVQLAYDLGQRHFGENHALEMKQKHEDLPKDIKWHFIGHLQTNKIKYIIPFVHLIHSIDSLKLLQDIDKQALKYNREVDCLLQFHIATEESKFGFSLNECEKMLQSPEFASLKNVRICGVMGMASLTDDRQQIRQEFHRLHEIFDLLKSEYFAASDFFKEISMGMTDDYTIAILEGSTMVRIGSAIFGARDYGIEN